MSMGLVGISDNAWDSGIFTSVLRVDASPGSFVGLLFSVKVWSGREHG
jgi:hypothetical protein